MALGLDDENKQPQGLQQNQQPPGGQPQGQAPTAIQRPNPQRKATGFTNIGRMLQASRGSGLGQAVAGGIQGQTQQSQQGLQQQQGQFQQQSQQGRVGTEQDVQQMQNVLQDPTKATQSDVDAFTKFRTQGYTGPQGLQNAQQLASQAQQAGQMGQAVGSSAGRMGLLQRFAGGGGGRYGAGQQRLDEMLLGRSSGDQLRQARQQALTASGQVQRGVQEAQKQAQQYGQEAEAFKQQVTGAVGSQQKAQEDILKARAAQAQTEKEALSSQLASGLQSGEITADQAAQLGLTEGQKTYGVDLSRFLSTDPTRATAQNVANAQEMAKMNALSQLGGQQAFGDAGQAGSFYKNQFSMDPNLQKALDTAKQSYEAKTGSIQNIAQQNLDKAYALAQVGGVLSASALPDELKFGSGSREQVEAALRANNLSGLLGGSKMGYKAFADLASGGGGGYDYQKAYQDALAQQAALDKEYGGSLRFKKLAGMTGMRE